MKNYMELKMKDELDCIARTNRRIGHGEMLLWTLVVVMGVVIAVNFMRIWVI